MYSSRRERPLCKLVISFANSSPETISAVREIAGGLGTGGAPVYGYLEVGSGREWQIYNMVKKRPFLGYFWLAKSPAQVHDHRGDADGGGGHALDR